MKKSTSLLFTNVTISVFIYIMCYAIKTFVFWEFTNHLSWVINMPNYSPDTRIVILFLYVIYQLVLLSITAPIIYKTNNS